MRWLWIRLAMKLRRQLSTLLPYTVFKQALAVVNIARWKQHEKCTLRFVCVFSNIYYETGIFSIKYAFLFVQVFALENPDVNVLNYAPGPVDTNMFRMVCETIADSKAKKMYNEMKEKKTVLTTEQTINRLVQILKERKYNSADHVDYYDKL